MGDFEAEFPQANDMRDVVTHIDEVVARL